MQYTGTTTDTFVAVLTQTDVSDGLHFFGGIKNTDGANTMTVRVTVTDVWGDNEVQSFTVVAGMKLSFNTISDSFVTAQPPFSDILVEVQSASAGNPAIFDVRTVLF